jgi:hypothetical protein
MSNQNAEVVFCPDHSEHRGQAPRGSQRYARVHHDELAARVLDLMSDHPAWHLPLGYKDGVYGAERVPSGAYLVGVGMAITGHPLHGSRRAERPHRALASGDDATAT